ncbi:MAG: hypothetical protein AB7S26_18100 [Sandaracinaceae bacterium]
MTAAASGPNRVERALVLALVVFALAHLAALGSMALVLRSGMDPTAGAPAERMAWIASHATTWRIGWLPWQLSTFAGIAVSVSLLRWARGDRTAVRIAIVALLLDVGSAIVEQWSEAMLVTRFIDVSRGDDLAAWRTEWALHAALTGVWANWGYTAMTACWMEVARRRLGRRVLHGAIEAAVIALFTVASALSWLATRGTDDDATARWFMLSAAVNGPAFLGLVLWALVLARRVRARVTPR